MKALSTARDEMSQIVEDQRVLRALRSKITPASRYVIKPGDLVRVVREKERRWLGPVEVVKIEGKSVHVKDTLKVMKFNMAQVMLFKIDNAAEDEGLERIFQHSDDQDEEQQNTAAVYLNETLDSSDPRTLSKKAQEAVEKELEGLYPQGVFEEVHKEDIPSNAVILPSKFV